MLGLNYEQIISKIQTEKGLSQEEIENKIKEKLKQLSDLISKEGAAHIVANELGVKLFDVQQARRFKIKDLSPVLRSVELVAKVINKYEIREFKTEKREGKVATLFAGDDTGRIRIVIWDENIIDNSFSKINEGDIVKVSNGYVRENNGYKELHLGSSSKIEINPPGESIDHIAERTEVNHKHIKDLNENEFVSIVGTVVQIFEPRFYEACPECNKKVENGQCKEHGAVTPVTMPVVNIYFDDGTDSIRVVLFRDIALKFLQVSKEEVSKLKDPAEFQKVKDNLLGEQLKITGRVNKNEMFGRLEFSATTIEEAKPQEIATELVS